jgi:hypothetical protein
MRPINLKRSHVTHESRAADECDRVQSLGPVRPLPPPARPVESYGIELVQCALGPRDRLTLKACTTRFKLANAPNRRAESASARGQVGDLRASRCRGCALGAERCGRKVAPPKPVVDHARVCRCGRSFDPDTVQCVKCPLCMHNEHARAGASTVDRRASGVER